MNNFCLSYFTLKRLLPLFMSWLSGLWYSRSCKCELSGEYMIFIFKYNKSAKFQNWRTPARKKVTVRSQSRVGKGDPDRPVEVVKRKFIYYRTGEKIRVRGCFVYRGQRKAKSSLSVERASLCTNEALMTCSWESHLPCFCCRNWTKPLPVPWGADPSVCISGPEYTQV
jgi:hypothetical protein